jgi:hypothetical protein
MCIMANGTVDHRGCAAAGANVEELLIQSGADWSAYEGSRALLEAENVIPVDIEWPVGSTSVHWDQGNLGVRLRRVRPKRLRGPMSCWTSGDYWELYWCPITTLPYCERLVLEKHAELKRALYLRTVKGQVEARQRFDAYWATKNDRSFQAFKQLIPALCSSKRGRKAVSAMREAQQ